MVNIFEYQYASDKGSTVAGHVFNSPLGYDVDKNYSSSLVAGEVIDAVDGSSQYTTQYHPLLGTPTCPGKTITVVDAEAGVISGSPALAASDVITYYYDNETVPVNAPEIKLNVKSLPIETKSRKLKALWAFDAAYELNKELTSKVA